MGLEPLTGKVLWEYGNWSCSIPIPSAVDAGENRVLVAAGYQLGTVMLKVDKKSDNTYEVKELFKTVEFGDQTKPPVLYNGYFYAQYGTNNRRDGLACMDMEGKVMWKTKRAPDFNKGSMILAEGLLLATDGANKLYLIEPDPAAFKQLASVEMFGKGSTDAKDQTTSRDGSPTQNWAPLALADGKLLIRDQSRMICVKVTQ